MIAPPSAAPGRAAGHEEGADAVHVHDIAEELRVDLETAAILAVDARVDEHRVQPPDEPEGHVERSLDLALDGTRLPAGPPHARPARPAPRRASPARGRRCRRARPPRRTAGCRQPHPGRPAGDEDAAALVPAAAHPGDRRADTSGQCSRPYAMSQNPRSRRTLVRKRPKRRAIVASSAPAAMASKSARILATIAS